MAGIGALIFVLLGLEGFSYKIIIEEMTLLYLILVSNTLLQFLTN